MSDDGLVSTAVKIISCSTRDNVEWGARAFKIWNERHDLDPSQCVEVTRRELYENKPEQNYKG